MRLGADKSRAWRPPEPPTPEEQLERWLSFVENHAERGSVYQRGVAECKSFGIERHPELMARLDTALARANEMNGVTDEAEAVLMPLSRVPPLNHPVRRRDGVVVFFRVGRPFVLGLRHANQKGKGKLAKYVGQEGAYVYFRAATPGEVRALELHETVLRQRDERRDHVLTEIHALRSIVLAGERPIGHHEVRGEELAFPRLAGDDELELDFWFVIDDSHIWCCEICTKAEANMSEGAFAASGHRIAFDVDVATRLRSVLE